MVISIDVFLDHLGNFIAGEYVIGIISRSSWQKEVRPPLYTIPE